MCVCQVCLLHFWTVVERAVKEHVASHILRNSERIETQVHLNNSAMNKGDGLDQHNCGQLSQGATASQQALQIHHHMHHHAKERSRGQHVRINGVGHYERQLLPGVKIRGIS